MPLATLPPLIFGLTPFGLFISIYLFFLQKHNFMPFWLTPTFQKQKGRKTRFWCSLYGVKSITI
jgi:hypothetical protein